MQIAEFLKRITEASGVSGAESMEAAGIARETLASFADEVRTDAMGNVIALKRGEGGPRIMLAGHMDEIGLIVSKLDGGFLRFLTVGGFDARTLLGQEVLVHAAGGRVLKGVIGCRPPHVLPPSERNKIVPIDDLFIDVGLDAQALAGAVAVGDLVTLRRTQIKLGGDYVVDKALDDRAAVAAIAVCLEALSKRRHAWDVYGVATVQEEVGLRGAITSAFGIAPQLAVAIDVGFGDQSGVSEDDSIKMGGGPAIAIGPNIHPKVHERLVATAKALEMPYQIDPAPGATGTDAWAIQVTQEGIPTGLLSIPLRSMHTTVETVSVCDVERTGRLLAEFIAGLDEAFAQEIATQVRRPNERGG